MLCQGSWGRALCALLGRGQGPRERVQTQAATEATNRGAYAVTTCEHVSPNEIIAAWLCQIFARLQPVDGVICSGEVDAVRASCTT